MRSQEIDRALAFAKGAVNATSAAFYQVDKRCVMHDFVLDGMTFEFIGRYVDKMNQFDPLHIRSAGARPIARLKEEIVRSPCAEFAAYETFCSAYGIVDSVEFFFRRDGEIFAGLNVGWSDPKAIPDGMASLVPVMHEYLQYNLTPVVGNATGSGVAARFALTDRETEVLELLSCGQTNRDIAECLSLRLPTVKTHIQHIFEKLGVETRSAAVAVNLGHTGHRN
jgi:DNA-binding CsgD family transcriptional regulator